ncbi:MAG TPA: hypothetical protein PLZ51_22970 [Aggregatilineales bacterium]|nr:hypothetical protein [Aggregatilineales bacterium]
MSDKKLEIYRRLNLPPKGIFIERTTILDEENSVHILCQYDPDNMQPFELLFSGCEKVDMFIFRENFVADEFADVIGMTLGQDNLVEDAVIHTDSYEIIILYKTLTITKNS